MYSLLAYGSLLHPDELARHAWEHAPRSPVRVQGFRRSFCQEPSWRLATSMERAVLTVQPSSEHWMNALLIHGFDARALADLDYRERGYTRVAIPPEQIEPYESDAGIVAGETVLYLGREEKYNAQILPSEEYLQICLAGAAAWGEHFLRDFLRSTFVQDHVPLSEYGLGRHGRIAESPE